MDRPDLPEKTIKKCINEIENNILLLKNAIKKEHDKLLNINVTSDGIHIVEQQNYFKTLLSNYYNIDKLNIFDFMRLNGGFINIIFTMLLDNSNIKRILFTISLPNILIMPYDIRFEVKMNETEYETCGIFERLEYNIESKLQLNTTNIETRIKELIINEYQNYYRTELTHYINNYFIKNKNNKFNAIKTCNLNINEKTFDNVSFINHINFDVHINNKEKIIISLNNNLYSSFKMINYNLERI